MAKDWERKEGYKLYVTDGKTAKECASILKVTEKTFGKWVDEDNWKERRASHLTSINSGNENINQLINVYAENAIALEQEKTTEAFKSLTKPEQKTRLEEILKEKISLVDAISKLNKAKESFEKENRIPYNVYINVSEQIMNSALEKMPKEMHAEVLDFFENHINEIAVKYK